MSSVSGFVFLNFFFILCAVFVLFSSPMTVQESALTPSEIQLRGLKDSLSDSPHIAAVVNCCRTYDQVRRVALRTLLCVRACVRARARVCVCVCVCERERERERARSERKVWHQLNEK